MVNMGRPVSAMEQESWFKAALGIKEPHQEKGHHAGPSRPFEEILWVCSFHIPSYISSEKAMATHSSTLAWKIPWMEEPGRL